MARVTWLGGIAVLCSLAAAAAEPTWKSVYFFDQDLAGLTLHDLHWPGPQCILAVGVQQEARGKTRSVALTSNDGGASWSLNPLKSHARSAMFVNERMGWVVTEDGVDRTNDCGKTWERLGREKNLLRVWFRDEALGWGAGAPKKAVVTRDGGRTWKNLQAVDAPKSDPDRSLYGWVEFGNDKLGIMVGWHTPARRGPQFPAWMDPEDAQLRRQWPSLTLMLQTIDGGATWKGMTASLMGRIQRVRMSPDGSGLAIIEFDQSFEWPSEVHGMGVGKEVVRRLYRDKNHFITDAALGPEGWIYLAGVEVPGTMRLPVPGKVRIIRSRDLTNWTTMKVDYRASATRVTLARSPSGELLAATDGGMILKLQ